MGLPSFGFRLSGQWERREEKTRKILEHFFLVSSWLLKSFILISQFFTRLGFMFPSHNIHLWVIIHSVFFLLSFPWYFRRHLILFSFIFPVYITNQQMVFMYVFFPFLFFFFSDFANDSFLYFLLYEPSWPHTLHDFMNHNLLKYKGKLWMILASHKDEWNQLIVSGREDRK